MNMYFCMIAHAKITYLTNEKIYSVLRHIKINNVHFRSNRIFVNYNFEKKIVTDAVTNRWRLSSPRSNWIIVSDYVFNSF